MEYSFEVGYRINLSHGFFWFKNYIKSRHVLRLRNRHRLRLSASHGKWMLVVNGRQTTSPRRRFDCELQLEHETQKGLGGWKQTTLPAGPGSIRIRAIVRLPERAARPRSIYACMARYIASSRCELTRSCRCNRSAGGISNHERAPTNISTRR